MGWTVEEKYHNIFYLSGFVEIPIQIVVARDLGDEYLPLQILTGRAKESEIRRFMEYRKGLTDKSDIEFADAVVSASAEANREIYEKLKEEADMNGVLREIMREDMREEFVEAERKATSATLSSVAERMINDGLPGEMITKYSRLGRHDIDVIAKRMNRIVSWGDNRT